MADSVEKLELFAWVGEDELGSGEVGIKRGSTPAGLIPLVSVDKDKIGAEYIQSGLQQQANYYGKTIKLCRFVFEEEVIAIQPKERNVIETPIQVNPNKMCGKPTVGPARFSVAQLIAELAEGDRNLGEICEDFDLDCANAHEALQQVACLFDRKFSEGENKGVTVVQGFLQRQDPE